ncbi:MAG: type II secretion system F family protein [Lachnospiraceae bacterium]|nr:type II secretion system F family protein [Lachnospiraceae bacterium]
MAQYSYKIVDKAGKTKRGTIEAESIDKAKNSLKAEGSILSLEEASALSKDINISFGKKKKVKVRDMGVFCKQFKSILQAGIGMVDALDMLAQQTNSKVLKEALKNVKDNVQKGDTLNMAMRKEGTVFPSLLLNMIEAGEASGSLEVALDRMSTHFDKDARLKGLVKKAMMYPIVLLIVTVIIVVIMLVKVLPGFASTFASMGSELPAYTQFVMGLSDSLIETWYLWVLGIVAVAFVYRTYAKSESGSRKIAAIKLKIPILGDLFTKTECARFSRTLSTLLAAGMPLIEAIETTGKTLDNVMFKDALAEAVIQVQRGAPLSAPIKASGIFPNMVVHMLSIGEESGNVEEMLDNVAEYYDEEVTLATDSATAMMEPLIIVVMAVVVVGIIAAVYAPVLSMYNLAEG